nr:hypothetical protein [Lachnospiraceae bacterium]
MKKKLELKIVKRILLIGFTVVCLCIIVCAATKLDLFAYIGIGLAVVTLIFWVIFGRCPACGKFLRRSSSKICRFCGQQISWK